MKPTPLDEVAKMLQGHVMSHGVVSGVAADSRHVRAGDLFFALPGAKTDGHAFLQEAASRGAAGAVVEKGYQGNSFGLPLIRCEDVLAGLQKLSRAVLSQYRAKTVAVTGSLGKTTTKDFIAQLLKGKFRLSVSPGNSNSQIGLPLSVLNHTSPEDEVLILEMGMTHPGQIAKLVEIVPPTVAVVTKVALVHACNFPSLTGIAQAKAEIFCHRKTEKGFFHYESNVENVLSNSGGCAKSSFSICDEAADVYLVERAGGLEIVDRSGKRPQSTRLPLLPVPGDHNKHNFLAAASVARYLGMEWEEIAQAIPTLCLPERRLQQVEKYGALFINDSYNASEPSMKAALDCLPVPKAGSKRIAVLGEMLELGQFSAQCHESVADYALARVDLMFCFGTECRRIYEHWQRAGRQVFWAQERKDVVEALKSKLGAGDVVLLKGSRSKEVWKVLDELA